MRLLNVGRIFLNSKCTATGTQAEVQNLIGGVES